MKFIAWCLFLAVVAWSFIGRDNTGPAAELLGMLALGLLSFSLVVRLFYWLSRRLA